MWGQFDYPLNLHISQTTQKGTTAWSWVWLSFEFTYLSNCKAFGENIGLVWLSFEFTYLSNLQGAAEAICLVWLSFEFTYLSNGCPHARGKLPVWLSFEFTYLSNGRLCRAKDIHVWLSFEFTYLSNWSLLNMYSATFDYPLNLHISQTVTRVRTVSAGLIILWIYISLKPDRLPGRRSDCLIILWIYISLKRTADVELGFSSLIILWIYISLKHWAEKGRTWKVWLSFEFTYLSNCPACPLLRSAVWLSFEFTYLSNPSAKNMRKISSLIILWIYISLKPQIWSTDYHSV